MKKFVAFSLAVLLFASALVGLTGCGGKTTEIMMKNKDGDLYVWGTADVDIFSLKAGKHDAIITIVNDDGTTAKAVADIYVCEINNAETVLKDYRIFCYMYKTTGYLLLYYNQNLGYWSYSTS